MRLLKSRHRARWRFVLCILLAIAGLTTTLYARRAYATEPPPPIEYTMTVNRSGGDEGSMFYIDNPGGPWTTPTSEQIQESFAAGTWIDIGIEIECPCSHRFKHWLVNDEVVEDAGPHQIAGFYLNENTTAIAVFEEVPEVTEFALDEENTIFEIVPPPCALVVKYTWESTTGLLEDLTGSKVYEVLTYDLSISNFDTEIVPFLESGLTETEEKTTLPEPWNTTYGEVPKLKRWGDTSATTGQISDYHSRGARPSPLTDMECITIRQWYVSKNRAGCWYLVGGPFDIKRCFTPIVEDIIYCIIKHGHTACAVTE